MSDERAGRDLPHGPRKYFHLTNPQKIFEAVLINDSDSNLFEEERKCDLGSRRRR